MRFAIEELPPELLLAAPLKVADKRFDGDGIRRLYESVEHDRIGPGSVLLHERHALVDGAGTPLGGVVMTVFEGATETSHAHDVRVSRREAEQASAVAADQ